MRKFLAFVGTALLLTSCAAPAAVSDSISAQRSDEIRYTLLEKAGDIQIRRYAPTPVAQVPTQKIPMTTPVAQSQADANSWTVGFYMPPDMRLQDTPAPRDERVAIREIPAQKMAAIQFSGFMNDSDIQKHEATLRQYLQEQGLNFEDKPLYAQYNQPFTPPFMGRNEVLFVLTD